jgi:hypothetical protein
MISEDDKERCEEKIRGIAVIVKQSLRTRAQHLSADR